MPTSDRLHASAHGVEKVALAKRREAVSFSDGARSVERKEEIAPRASTSLPGCCRERIKEQRADELSGAWRHQRGNPLYLAVLIGRQSQAGTSRFYDFQIDGEFLSLCLIAGRD
jgi:hypothetical protein